MTENCPSLGARVDLHRDDYATRGTVALEILKDARRWLSVGSLVSAVAVSLSLGFRSISMPISTYPCLERIATPPLPAPSQCHSVRSASHCALLLSRTRSRKSTHRDKRGLTREVQDSHYTMDIAKISLAMSTVHLNGECMYFSPLVFRLHL